MVRQTAPRPACLLRLCQKRQAQFGLRLLPGNLPELRCLSHNPVSRDKESLRGSLPNDHTTSLSLRRVGWPAHAFRARPGRGAAPCCETIYALLAVAAAYTGPGKMDAYRKPKNSRRAGRREDARARPRAALSIFIEHAAMSIRCLF